MAILFDTSVNTSGTNPSVAITRGTGASNYIGVVFLGPFGSTRSASGVTWGGASMTQLAGVTDATPGVGASYYIFYIVNPPTGAQTVTATTTNTYGMGVLTYSGVDQTTPFDTNFDGAANAFVTNTSVEINPAPLPLTGTTHVDNSLVIAGADNGGAGGTSPGTGTSQRIVNTNVSTFESSALVSPAGSTTLNITASGTQTIFGLAAALQPPSAAVAGTKFLSLLGIGA